MAVERGKTEEKEIVFEDFKAEILNDFRIACESRETSLLGRREVLTGKAKFGIFGDGKEVAQLAMAKFFENGDFRSGYYRDQTFMMAIDQLTVQQYFAGLYAHTDHDAEPFAAGRQMGGHFATKNINPDGSWKNLTEQKNSSSDISPTAGQMSRLLGLAYASKFYRNNPDLKSFTNFSKNGNEIAFGTIGDASTSEGVFWESLNAAGVLQVPMIMSIWDDGHGISVPKKFQTIKESISEALKGFQRNETHPRGFEILKSKGWDYPHLIETYKTATRIAREEHVPVLIHVEEVTQPQGHSTSGSHERYKTSDRLEWEANFDPIKKMGEWMISSAIASEEEVETVKKEAKVTIRNAKKIAWSAFLAPIQSEQTEVCQLITNLASESTNAEGLTDLQNLLANNTEPSLKEVVSTAKRTMRLVRNEQLNHKQVLSDWLLREKMVNHDKYNSHLYCETAHSPLNVKEEKAIITDASKTVDGRLILKNNFDYILNQRPEVLIFGEDAGHIGGVNQGLEGLQEKYGVLRVFDTGIRENTIIGQAIGLALRGFRPIAEIQYLDYLLYAIQIISDDLATLSYRTKGSQKAPVIIRTRGHRLEGIWHSGSPMAMILGAARGVHLCVPRNMTQAAGFYNTLLQGDDPAIVIESLNGYRLKEKLPENIGTFNIPLGIPETLVSGSDITVVCYGSMVRMVLEVEQQLAQAGISIEIIDVQTLIPFDINHSIVESLKKTNRLLIIDEDVSAGGSAYILQKIMEEQKGYNYLDSPPKTLTSYDHRPAYGSDGDYFSKPNLEDIFDAVYEIMNEAEPEKHLSIY